MLALQGTSLGSNPPQLDVVQIHGKVATILMWSDTAIVIELPALGPGNYPLVFEFADGYADTRYSTLHLTNAGII